MKDANELLLGGGNSKAAVFATIGAIVEGTVVGHPESREQTDLATGEVKRYKSGDPMMMVLIKIQTTLRDPDDPEDDGIRTLFAKYTMMKAIGKAMTDAGVKKIEPGGYLQVGYSGDIPSQTRGYQPTKAYVAKYTPPAPSANTMLTQAAFGSDPWASSTPAAPAPQQARALTTLEQLKATSFNAQGAPQEQGPPF